MNKHGKPPHLSQAARELAGPSTHDRQRVRAGIEQAVASGKFSDTVRRVDFAIASGAPLSGASWLASKISLAKLLLPTLLIGVGVGVFVGRQTAPATEGAAGVSASLPTAGSFETAPLRAEPALPSEPAEPAVPVFEREAPRHSDDARPAPHSARRAYHSHRASAGGHAEPVAEIPMLTEQLAISPASPPPAPPEHHVAEELRLMHAASNAVTASDWQRAERALADHTRRFPNGALSHERRALHLIALCKQNQTPKRGELDAFLASAAQSPLSVRVREACGAQP